MTPIIRSFTLSKFDPQNRKDDDESQFKIDHSIVHVWSIEFNSHFHELFKRARNLISQDEYNKAKRLHRSDDYKRYLTGRIVLRILLSRYWGCDPLKISLTYHNGKPSFSDSPLKFNLSYSDKHIFISFGLCNTGIDIEFIKRDFAFHDILNSCFSAGEIANIDKNDDSLKERFFLQWTRKEALLKYTGQGIIDDLTIIPSLDGLHTRISNKLKISSDLNLISFKPNDDLVGSLAYPTSVASVEFFRWQS